MHQPNDRDLATLFEEIDRAADSRTWNWLHHSFAWVLSRRDPRLAVAVAVAIRRLGGPAE
jgi:hypothetical protein